MNRSWFLAMTATAVTGCGSSNPQSTPPAAINPCATPGATYVETLVQSSGTCTAIPSQIVPVAPSGTIELDPSVACAEFGQNGCTEWDSVCTWTSDGISYTATTVVTFASDGSSVSGILEVSADDNGTTCTGTYDVTATPQ